MQLVRSKGLGENVDNLPISSNIPWSDLIAQDPLAHKVIMYFYVLGASMEYRVLGQFHATDVITIDWDWIGNFDA